MLGSRLTAFAAIAALTACRDSLATHGIRDPDLIEIQARDMAEPGDTVVVRLWAKARVGDDGIGLPETMLRLTVTKGAGSVVPESVTTDQNGAASVRWVLGSAEDTQALRVVAPNDVAALSTLRARWVVRSVQLDMAGTSVVIDTARPRVTVLNRLGGVIARPTSTWIETEPEIPGQPVAVLSSGLLVAQGPGFVTLHASSEGVDAAPIVVRIAPHIAVLAAFDQAAPAVGGDTVIARGYRLDLAGGLTLAGALVTMMHVDSATLRVVVPPTDTELCRGWAYLPAALATGVIRTPGVRVRRPGELTLAPGDVIRLGPTRGGCLRLAPADGARYVLMYADTRPIIAAQQGSFPDYVSERLAFSVAFDRWEGGPSTVARAMPGPMSIAAAGPGDVVRPSGVAVAAPPDAIEYRAMPWRVGDRSSVSVGTGYESGTIVDASGPFVALVLDSDPLRPGELMNYRDAMVAVQREVVPMLRAALSDRIPVTTTGSGQFVIVLSKKAARGNAGIFFGSAVAVVPNLGAPFPPFPLSNPSGLFVLLAHEIAHAWQDRFNRDQCSVDIPFGCWSGSKWAVEGGATFLSQEALRRLVGEPLIGSPRWDIYDMWHYVCCDPIYSLIFGEGYADASWFLRDLLARAVYSGAPYDRAIAAVSRGALEGWYGLTPRSLTSRLTALYGTAWNPVDAYEASVWGLGMDESPSPIYQYLATVNYHWGRVGAITAGQALTGEIAGDSFGHLDLDDRGAGGAYRYSVGTDGMVWALGRVR